MSLDKQVIDISFAQGADNYQDPKTMGGKLTLLQNAVVRRAGEISKRYGSRTIKQTAGMATAQAITTFGDELLQQAGYKIYSYSQTQDKWSDRGTCYSVAVSTKQVIRKTVAQTQADSVVAYGAELHAYVDSNGVVRYSFIDSSTGTYITSDSLINGAAYNGKNPRCCALAGYLYVFWVSGGTLYCNRITPVTGTIDFYSIATDIGTAGQYDIAEYEYSRIYIAYLRTSDIKLTVRDFRGAVLPVPDTVIAETATTIACDTMDVALVGPKVVGLSWFVSATGTRAGVYGLGLDQYNPPVTLDSDLGAVGAITIYGGTVGLFNVYVEKTNADPTKTHIRRSVWSHGVSVINISIGGAIWMRGVALASKQFLQNGATVMVAVVHASPLQSTFFVADVSGSVVSKHQAGTAGGITLNGILPYISIDTNIFRWAVINKTQLQSRDGNLFSLTGVALTQLDFSDNSSFSSAEIGGTLHIVGGYLSMYDGISCVEHGFHLWPEGLTNVTAGGSIAAGTYLFCAVYEWTDGKGQLHRSAPSVPLTVTLGGASNVTVTIPTLRLTAKQGTRSAVSIALYRTAASQTGVFYRVSSLSAPRYNDLTVDSVTITDNLPDASIFANEILYTSGGVLDNAAAPAARFIGVWQNRIMLAGLEDGTAYTFSKSWTPGGPVEFVAEFANSLDAEGGPITGIAPLEDKFIFLKRDRYYYTYGEGPNELGQGSYYPRPQQAPVDTGCVDQQSIARMPGGIVFKSAKGFMALQSNLSMTPIGEPVRGYIDNNVTASVLSADNSQVRFLHSDGPCLVYDYESNQWSSFDNFEAVDSTVWKNQFVFLRTNGEVFVEDTAVYRDNGKAINITAETGWLNLAGLAGYQRVYRIVLIGEYVSEHSILIQVAYDYDEVYRDEIRFYPQYVLDTTPWGGDIVYGTSTPYGSTGKAYTFEAHLTNQKCSAIRFKIRDQTISASEGTGEGLTLTSLSLQVGVKRGLGKKPRAKYSGAEA